jgi:inhibitor of KinA sporulation pathway (predicted exonuclease)
MGKQRKQHQTPQTSGAQEDARFDKVFSDPRFVPAPNKVKKVEIDQRF